MNQFNAGNQQATNLANMSAQNQMGLAGYQGAMNQSQFNAGNQQAANLANQSSANQMTLAGYQGGINQSQFDTGNAQQMALANMSNTQAANLAAYQGGINQGQFNASNQQAANLAAYQGNINQGQFNAGNQQQMALGNMSNTQAANLAGYQGNINQSQFNTGQANTIGMANLDLAGRYGLQQGQMTQQNNQFNAAQDTQNNQFNASGEYNAMGAQADNNRLNFGANINALGSAYSLGQGVIQGGLAAAGIKAGLAGAANPNAAMLNMYGAAQPVGSQALGPATSIANNWATNATETSGYNANAQNWTNYAPMSRSQYGAQQSGAAGGGWAGAASGAASGAVLGSAAGPYGAVIGGVVGGAAGYFSDKRLKKNIRDNEYGLEDISKLKTYQYDYKDGADNEAGVMAQELRKVMPEAVTEAEMMDGKKKVKRLMIKPMFLTAALVNSVKELNEKVAALGSSFTSTKQKPKPMALGSALMDLV
jgi:hypothetical protein